MNYKYFDKVDKFIELSKEKLICDICREVKLCFNADWYRGKNKLHSVCPSCLQSGKLRNLDISTCTGDFEELKTQLKQLMPNYSESEIAMLAIEKSIELETTTPHLVTRQDWYRPCIDGEYCKFIGYGSKLFYKKLAGALPAKDFFKDSFYINDSYYDSLWENVPDENINNYNESSSYNILFYIFKSLYWEKVITIWDCV